MRLSGRDFEVPAPTTAIRRVETKKRVIIAFSFGGGANEEVARAHHEEG
jgi:hypothetical protein